MLKEPTIADFAGKSPLRLAKRLVLATRPMFLTASILPVLLGTAAGYRAGGHLDLAAFALVLAAYASIHAAANVFNDVSDDISGTDRINDNRLFPFTGGSRFIQNEIMSRRQMLRWGIALLCIAALPGVALVYLKGFGVLIFGAAGSAVLLLHHMPPVQLGARGFGEAAVGIGFGVLPVSLAAWLQAGAVTGHALLLSIPVALWIANVLLINEIPDEEADRKSGKNTLVVILGRNGAGRVYLGLNLGAVLAVATAAAVGSVPAGAVIGPAALCLAAIPAARTMASGAAPPHAVRRAIKVTLAVHALGTIWLTAWAAA